MTDTPKPAVFRQYQNVSIHSDVHKDLVAHLPDFIKLGKWVEQAIKEKIKRESKLKKI
jgi:hypothetical protein